MGRRCLAHVYSIPLVHVRRRKDPDLAHVCLLYLRPRQEDTVPGEGRRVNAVACAQLRGFPRPATPTVRRMRRLALGFGGFHALQHRTCTLWRVRRKATEADKRGQRDDIRGARRGARDEMFVSHAILVDRSPLRTRACLPRARRIRTTPDAEIAARAHWPATPACRTGPHRPLQRDVSARGTERRRRNVWPARPPGGSRRAAIGRRSRETATYARRDNCKPNPAALRAGWGRVGGTTPPPLSARERTPLCQPRDTTTHTHTPRAR